MERHKKTGNKNLSTKDIIAAFAYLYGCISKSEYLDLVDLLDAKRKKCPQFIKVSAGNAKAKSGTRPG